MSRAQYTRYVIARLAESLAIAAGAASLAHLLQALWGGGPVQWVRGGSPGGPPGGLGRALELIRIWAWPAAWAAAAHVLLWRRIRYRVPPWGGFVCGEKGNEWQAIESLLRHHGREEDLCVLRTARRGLRGTGPRPCASTCSRWTRCRPTPARR
jgi:hypothetical protein